MSVQNHEEYASLDAVSERKEISSEIVNGHPAGDIALRNVVRVRLDEKNYGTIRIEPRRHTVLVIEDGHETEVTLGGLFEVVGSNGQISTKVIRPVKPDTDWKILVEDPPKKPEEL